jgi:hypothetical protein
MVCGHGLRGGNIVAPNIVIQLLESVQTGFTTSGLLVTFLQEELSTEVTLGNGLIVV